MVVQPISFMALSLVRYRPSLAGADWSATPGQRRHWQVLADDLDDGGFALSARGDAE